MKLPAKLEVDPIERTLKCKASALRADKPWVPQETDIQRGRVIQLEAFGQAHNLPLQEYAKLANKSRQQIYKDIDARRLLALNIGPRGRKLPDWQLDPVRQQLTQTVLQGSENIDNWTVYRALSEPLESLSGRSPVDAVTPDSIDEMARAVFNVLSVNTP